MFLFLPRCRDTTFSGFYFYLQGWSSLEALPGRGSEDLMKEEAFLSLTCPQPLEGVSKLCLCSVGMIIQSWSRGGGSVWSNLRKHIFFSSLPSLKWELSSMKQGHRFVFYCTPMHPKHDWHMADIQQIWVVWICNTDGMLVPICQLIYFLLYSAPQRGRELLFYWALSKTSVSPRCSDEMLLQFNHSGFPSTITYVRRETFSVLPQPTPLQSFIVFSHRILSTMYQALVSVLDMGQWAKRDPACPQKVYHLGEGVGSRNRTASVKPEVLETSEEWRQGDGVWGELERETEAAGVCGSS